MPRWQEGSPLAFCQPEGGMVVLVVVWGGGVTHQCGRVAICIELNPGGPVGWFGRDKDTEALPMIAQMMRSNQSRDNSLPI